MLDVFLCGTPRRSHLPNFEKHMSTVPKTNPGEASLPIPPGGMAFREPAFRGGLRVGVPTSWSWSRLFFFGFGGKAKKQKERVNSFQVAQGLPGDTGGPREAQGGAAQAPAPSREAATAAVGAGRGRGPEIERIN